MKRISVLSVLMVSILFGCASFTTYDPSTGKKVTESHGAFLLTRQASEQVKFNDTTGKLLEIRSKSNEDANGQVEVMKLVINMAYQAGALAATKGVSAGTTTPTTDSTTCPLTK